MHHILIVDADKNSTKILRLLLEGEGYKVTTTESAERALEAIEHNDYDLVLLDVVLPDMDGLDLCRRIRATSQVPILFLAMRSDVAEKLLGLRAGADDHLSKLVDLDELLARIRALLRRSPGQRRRYTRRPEPSYASQRHLSRSVALPYSIRIIK